MKNIVFTILCSLSLFFLNVSALSADELYIITTRDGSSIVARDYRFTDEYVEFTTENGLPGFIKRKEFVEISNMVGVPPEESVQTWGVLSEEDRKKNIWLLVGGIVVLLCCVFLMGYLGRKRKKAVQDDIDIYYGRNEKEPTTQGHLSFKYKGFLGHTSTWNIDVRRAYEVEGVLYIEGICTETEKKKTFRADRVVGPVTDLSNDHHAPMENFFVDAIQDK